MISAFDPLREITFATVLFRMVLAVLCGSAIGLERSSKNRPAGFRTHVLVCIAATAASLTGHYVYLELHLISDVTRLGAQVITGLGFLGAGTIIVTHNSGVKGLTTAAGLWATGILGLAIGAGFYEGALLGTALILFTELLLIRVTVFMRKDAVFNVEVFFSEKDALDRMMRYCKDRRLTIQSLQIHALSEQGSGYRAELRLRTHSGIHINELLSHVRAMKGIDEARQTGIDK